MDLIQKTVTGRMPELDALRGIAILWVILHNGALNGLGEAQGVLSKILFLVGNTGWVGVQLFFVLSGFLITGKLLDSRATARPFRNFYMRRTLRIFPLYYAFLILFVIVIPIFGWGHWSESSNLEQILYWTYLVNWGLPFIHDLTFPHLWSLAIEEQFYLVWPLLALLVNNRWLVWICGGLITSAITMRAYLAFGCDANWCANAMYTFTVARWDALALGALLAVAMRDTIWPTHIRTYAPRAFLVVSILLAIQLAAMREFNSTGPAAIINQTSIALWCVLLIVVSVVQWNNKIDRIRKIFLNRNLRGMGRYSYAVYVFHVPAKVIWFSTFTIMTMPNSQWEQLWIASYNFIGITALATSAAFVSWYFLEQPFLNLKRYFAESHSN